MANSVIDAIFQVATNTRVRMAMVMGTKLESGWNPNAVGDGGKSFGPFQIHLPAHPSMNKEKATNPLIAAQYMLKSYENGVNRVSANMWSTDPAMAAAYAAYYAERPAKFYGETRVRAAWPSVQAAMSGQDVGSAENPSGGSSNGGVTQTALTDYGGLIGQIVDWFASAGNLIIFGAITVGGFVLLGAGLYLLMKEQTNVAGSSVKAMSAITTVATLGRK